MIDKLCETVQMDEKVEAIASQVKWKTRNECLHWI